MLSVNFEFFFGEAANGAIERNAGFVFALVVQEPAES